MISYVILDCLMNILCCVLIIVQVSINKYSACLYDGLSLTEEEFINIQKTNIRLSEADKSSVIKRQMLENYIQFNLMSLRAVSSQTSLLAFYCDSYHHALTVCLKT